MKKLISILILIIAISAVLKAQDKIITKNGDTINCKIINISAEKIQYEQKNSNGQNIGKFIFSDQVCEYIKTTPARQQMEYREKSIREPVLVERPIRLSVNFGYGFLPSKFMASRNGMNSVVSTTEDDMNRYFRKLKNGINAGFDFYVFASEKFGLGLKYSFYATRTDIKESIPISGNNILQKIPTFVATELKERYYTHSFMVSMIFRQWLDEKHRFAMNELFSFGYLRLRNEIRGSIYSAPYPNSLITGNGLSTNFEFYFEYYPLKYMSISAGIGGYFNSIRMMIILNADGTSPYASRFVNTKLRDLSKLDFSLGVHFYLKKSNKNKNKK